MLHGISGDGDGRLAPRAVDANRHGARPVRVRDAYLYIADTHRAMGAEVEVRALLEVMLAAMFVDDADAELVADDVLGWGDEYFALPEREHGEHEEHKPRHTHADGHDEVPRVEASHAEDVAQLAEREDPADYPQPISNWWRMASRVRHEPFGKVRAQQPRISLRFLCSLNQ